MQQGAHQHEKEILRRAMRRAMNLTDKVKEEKKLLRQIISLPVWQEACTTLMYHPLPQEPNLLALLKQSSHRFFFTRMRDKELELYEWLPGVAWIEGPYGVQEPDPTEWRKASLAEIDLALVPGVAFDPQGHRLGRGAGYFDRLLGKPECRALKIGIAWSAQVALKIPSELHDVNMDFVVTSEKIFHSE